MASKLPWNTLPSVTRCLSKAPALSCQLHHQERHQRSRKISFQSDTLDATVAAHLTAVSPTPSLLHAESGLIYTQTPLDTAFWRCFFRPEVYGEG